VWKEGTESDDEVYACGFFYPFIVVFCVFVIEHPIFDVYQPIFDGDFLCVFVIEKPSFDVYQPIFEVGSHDVTKDVISR
jgi:hypothetical protein